MGGRLHAIEFLGMLGGAVLAASVFLPWYATDPENRFAAINGVRGAQSCWDVHPILRWLMLAAAVAPFVLAYIIVTDQQLSWARGEMTAVTSIAAMGLIFFNGALDRPGDPSSAISLRYGWFLAVIGAMLMFSSAARRSSSHERARKPPGTI
ncbi:MAG: hypothetical protein QOJ82_906 [Solirubrobacteraceae bacterium]|nr:hypothetical protein [Solirubrobacteraceae bacterium]